jgi:hypothetical protein
MSVEGITKCLLSLQSFQTNKVDDSKVSLIALIFDSAVEEELEITLLRVLSLQPYRPIIAPLCLKALQAYT